MLVSIKLARYYSICIIYYLFFKGCSSPINIGLPCKTDTPLLNSWSKLYGLYCGHLEGQSSDPDHTITSHVYIQQVCMHVATIRSHNLPIHEHFIIILSVTSTKKINCDVNYDM